MARFWEASCCISSSSQLPSLKKPITQHAPIGFAYFTLLQNLFVIRFGRVHARSQTHTPTGALLASSAIIIQFCPCSTSQERNKSKDRDCGWSEEGSYKEKRSNLQSQPHQSKQKLNSLSFVLWFTEDDKVRGTLVENMWEREKSRKKAFFIFKRWHWLFCLFQLSSVFHFLLVRSWLCRKQKSKIMKVNANS